MLNEKHTKMSNSRLYNQFMLSLWSLKATEIQNAKSCLNLITVKGHEI